MNGSDRLTAKIFDFFVTQRCTLNCKLCAAAIPYIKKPVHTPIDVAFHELDAFFQVWDYAERVELIGGEPLSHPNIYEIAKETLRYAEYFDKLRITTNATIVPSDKLCDFAANCGKEFDFIIDDYGTLSKNLSLVCKKLDQYHIPYRVDVYHGKEQRYGGWINFGDFKLLNTGFDADTTFRNCICPKNRFVCVNDGKAFSCVYAMCLYWLNGFFPNDGSCIDLFDESESSERKKHIANQFCGQPIGACHYCHGFDAQNGRRFPGPPEQVPREVSL